MSQDHEKLKRSMKSHHLFMPSLGGVIGTGLFLNAGYSCLPIWCHGLSWGISGSYALGILVYMHQQDCCGRWHMTGWHQSYLEG